MISEESPFAIQPIGVIHSCFKEKFGIPRQPGLAAGARGSLELFPPYNDIAMVAALETFSHIWIVFVFHGNKPGKWGRTVRPPRLGGNRRVGVFASRSGFRPNPVGISAVQLESIEQSRGTLFLHLKGIDLLDQTPVIDVKPYVPYSDRIMEAVDGYAEKPATEKLSVAFTSEADAVCATLESVKYPALKKLIIEIIGNDPRPGYFALKKSDADFGMVLFDLNIRFQVTGRQAIIFAIEKKKDL